MSCLSFLTWTVPMIIKKPLGLMSGSPLIFMIVAVSQDGNLSETAEHQVENPRVTNTAVGTTRSVMIAARTVSTNAERNVLKIPHH